MGRRTEQVSVRQAIVVLSRVRKVFWKNKLASENRMEMRGQFANQKASCWSMDIIQM